VTDPVRNKRVKVALGAVLLANAGMLLSFGSSRMLKHGSESVFGLDGRVWAFALLGLAVVGVGAAIALMVSARKP
jgi:hypothetical protein